MDRGRHRSSGVRPGPLQVSRQPRRLRKPGHRRQDFWCSCCPARGNRSHRPVHRSCPAVEPRGAHEYGWQGAGSDLGGVVGRQQLQEVRRRNPLRDRVRTAVVGEQVRRRVLSGTYRPCPARPRTVPPDRIRGAWALIRARRAGPFAFIGRPGVPGPPQRPSMSSRRGATTRAYVRTTSTAPLSERASPVADTRSTSLAERDRRVHSQDGSSDPSRVSDRNGVRAAARTGCRGHTGRRTGCRPWRARRPARWG